MDNQQAKFILQSYRPSGKDAADPIFAEPLQQAQRDPLLAKWFTDECRLDAAIAAKLCSISVPTDLKTAIFAAQKAEGRHHRPWPINWPWPIKLGIAALLTFLIGLGWLLDRSGPTTPLNYATYWNQVSKFISSSDFKLELESKNLAEMQLWLARRGAPNDLVLPSKLAQLPTMGCRTLNIKGSKASLFCFVADGNQMIHLIVIERKSLQDPPTEGAPQYAQHGAWSTASWSDQKKTYILTSMGGLQSVRSLL